MNSELATIFSTRGLRLTKPRQSVFDALLKAGKPLHIQDIILLCPEIDRVSVYRTIDLFHQLHILDTVHIGWKKQYELAGPFKPHHHHLYCKNCGKTVEINSNKLEDFVDDLAGENGFRATGHKFEIAGLCNECHS